jgi:hypothetical protein
MLSKLDYAFKVSSGRYSRYKGQVAKVTDRFRSLCLFSPHGSGFVPILGLSVYQPKRIKNECIKTTIKNYRLKMSRIKIGPYKN